MEITGTVKFFQPDKFGFLIPDGIPAEDRSQHVYVHLLPFAEAD